MSEPYRFNISLILLSLSVGACNALFDIERGTPAEADSGGTTLTQGSGGTTLTQGSGGSSAGQAGNGGSADSSGTSTTTSGGSSGGGSVTAGANGGNGSSSSAGGSNGGSGAASSTTGVGGTAGSGGAPVIAPVSCSCSSTTPGDITLIDDFEDGDGRILPRGGRQGAFYGFPEAYASGAQLDCDTGEDGNCVALCVEGVLDGDNHPFAGLGVTLFDDDGGQPYDATSFAGISFKLRGTIPPDAILRAEFPTTQTHPTTLGGTCTGDGCYDHYKVTIPSPTSESTFEHREVLFINLGQGNGGGAWTDNWEESVEAIWAPGELLNINWQVTSTRESLSSQPFSFCIDDIRLLEADATEPIATWDFETDVLDAGRVDPNVTISQASDKSAGGQYSLRADIETGGFGCSPYDCWMLDATECDATNGCFSVNKAVFALDDTENPLDIQLGDKVSLWFNLPAGDIQWVNIFFASGEDYEWSFVPLAFPAKRDDWYYAELSVPEDIGTPVHEWGIEIGAAPTFAGTVYLDEMSIHRP